MFTRARLAGLWILGSVISPAELEHLDDYSLAIDGDGGGTYAPSTAIVIGGSGVTLSGANHHVSGTLTVDNLAVISIASGGSIKAEGSGTADITLAVVTNVATLTVGANGIVNMGGALNITANGLLNVKNTGGIAVESGGTILVQSSGTVQTDNGSNVNVFGSLKIKNSTGVLTLEAGTTNLNAGKISHLSTSENAYASGSKLTGTIEVSGGSSSIVLKDSIDLDLDPARDWDRRATRVAATTYDTGVPQAADDMFSPLFDAPSLYTLAGSTSPVVTIFEIDPPPDGSLIVSATVKSIYGSIVLSTLAVATYELVKWQNGLTAAPVSISSLTNDTHATNGSDWNTVKTVTVTADANTITDRAYRYGLRVNSSYLTGTGARLEMYYDIALAGTATKVTGT
jgi:hypothetical protein